jgi:hypothetical protein
VSGERFRVRVGGRDFDVELSATAEGASAVVDGRKISIRALRPQPPGAKAAGGEALLDDGERRLRVAAVPGGKEGIGRFLVENRCLVEAAVETERDRLRAASRPASHRRGSATATSTLPGVIRRLLLRTGDRV